MHLYVSTDPVSKLQLPTQTPRLLWFLQERHWSGPGPQHPESEHSGSHTWPSATAHTQSSVQEKGPFLRRPALSSCLRFDVFHARKPRGRAGFVTALRRRPVVVEAVGSNPAAAEELRPVDGVVVAEPGVLADVDAAVADLAQGAQAQRNQGGDAHHHQGETSAGFGSVREAR